MQCACAVLSFLACPALHYISTFPYKGHDLKKKIIEPKMCVLIFSTTFVWIFFIVWNIEIDIIKNVYYIGVYVKNPLFLSDVNEIWIFSTYLQKKHLNIKFRENPFSGSLVIPCGQAYTQTDMTTWIVPFHNFANAPIKNCFIQFAWCKCPLWFGDVMSETVCVGLLISQV